MKKRGWAAAACALSLLLTCCAAPAPSGAESAPEAQATPEPQRQAFDLPFEMVSSPDLTSYGSGTAEGSTLLWDELRAFQGLDEKDLQNSVMVAQYLEVQERMNRTGGSPLT